MAVENDVKKADYVTVEYNNKQLIIQYHYDRQVIGDNEIIPDIQQESIPFEEVCEIDMKYEDGCWVLYLTTIEMCMNEHSEIAKEKYETVYDFPQLTMATASHLYAQIGLIALNNSRKDYEDLTGEKPNLTEDTDEEDDDDENFY